MSLSLLQNIIGRIFIEANLNFSGCELFEGSLDGLGPLLQEVLLILVEGEFSDLGAIEPDSNSVTDDGPGEEELGQQGLLNIGQGSAVGSLLGPVLLHPSGLDVPACNQEDGGLELLLQIDNQLLVKWSQEDFVAAMREVDKGDGFFLAVGDFYYFIDFKERPVLFVVAVQLGNYFLKSSSCLCLNG